MKPTAPEPGDRVTPLLDAARAGSVNAIGQALQQCRPYLLGVANRELEEQLQAKAGAADLVQETFLEAQRIFARFHGRTGNELLAWLRAILLNKIADFTRHYCGTDKRQVAREVPLPPGNSDDSSPEASLPADTPTPSKLVSQAEQVEAVRRAVDRLPEHYRQVLVWRQWDELPFEEIARRLDRSVDAARMLWWRALERLQHEVDGPP